MNLGFVSTEAKVQKRNALIQAQQQQADALKVAIEQKKQAIIQQKANAEHQIREQQRIAKEEQQRIAKEEQQRIAKEEQQRDIEQVSEAKPFTNVIGFRII